MKIKFRKYFYPDAPNPRLKSCGWRRSGFRPEGAKKKGTPGFSPGGLHLILGVMIMVNLFGCSGEKFAKYSSQDPLINVAMDYIAGWKYDETRGAYNSYAQVMFFPFKEGRVSPRALIAVTVKDQLKVDFTPLTAEAALADLLAKRMQFQEAKILSKSEITLLGAQALAVELSYLKLENLLKVDSKLILFKEKAIIFKKDNNFYFLRYEAPEANYAQFSPAFARMVKTLKIKN